MITALFLTGYLVIALACVALGAYLSHPGRTMLTLPGDVFHALPRRSRPAPINPLPPAPHSEPSMPVDEHADTQYHLVTPVMTPTNDEGHESHAEPEPVEVIKDEP